MAKKKKEGALRAVPAPQSTFPLGDLRAVEQYVRAFLGGDREDSISDLLSLGRDAAGVVARLAEEHGNEELRLLAKKLIAVPPQVKTNLMELRAQAVTDLVAGARADAPNATDLEAVRVPGNAVALFDPQRIAEAIVKGGRPRRDPERVRSGDVVWFAIEGAESVAVSLRTAAPPEAQPVIRVRLQVQSGIVFIGRPEAADGPRLGELRLDPFHTSLHEHLASGRLARLKPGAWVAAVHRTTEPGVRVYLSPDPAADGPPPPVDLGALIALPAEAGEGAGGA